MFFFVQQYEVVSFSAHQLENPQTLGQEMELVFLRTEMRMAVCIVNSRKAVGEFRDLSTGKAIRHRLWTAEMKAFYTLKNKEVPSPPFVFKLTIVGWIVTLMIGVFLEC